MSKLSPTIKTILAELKAQEKSIPWLSGECGVSHSTLYRTFEGEFIPNFEIIEKMAKALGLKIAITSE